MASSKSVKQATVSTHFDFPSSMQLTPTMTTAIFIEFLKQILFIKEQIPICFDKMSKKI